MEIESIQNFLSYAYGKYFSKERGRWVFRGHSDTRYQLIPSVGRGKHTSEDRPKHEKSLFDIFCREAQIQLAVLPTNDWEWLSLAQHHGLPTRFARVGHTIRSSPFIFSVESGSSVDGELFALRALDEATLAVRAASPFSPIEKPEKLFSNIVSPRIRAQEGLLWSAQNWRHHLMNGSGRIGHLSGIGFPQRKTKAHGSVRLPEIRCRHCFPGHLTG